MAHGQCVRAALLENDILIKANWHMTIECGADCWREKMGVAQHGARLAVADHLDITLQEVTYVTLHRQANQPEIPVRLAIEVKTSRLLSKEGGDLLRDFLTNTTHATDLFGFVVHSLELVVEDVDDVAGTMPQDEDQDDPFLEAYAPLEKEAEAKADQFGTIAGVPVGDAVPAGAIIGVAAGIVVLVASGVAFTYYRRRKLSSNRDVHSGKSSKDSANTVDMEGVVAVKT